MAMQIALAGIGKIARDQHIPTLSESPDWTLAATLSRSGRVDTIPAYDDFDAMLAAQPRIEAISLCMPPVPRYDTAQKALAAGLHVMLEKPPGATLSEVMALDALAKAKGVTLFASWHSRMADGVAAAKAWLAGKRIESAHITWKEDVRKWHPGQDWIFEPGGMGVFDPAINALSILTEILPMAVHLQQARLDIPSNRDAPIAARLSFSHAVTADLDFLQTGPQTWDIEVATDAGTLTLRDGGARLIRDGRDISAGANREYRGLYNRFAHLVREGESDVDLAPMIHVADAMILGRRVATDAFHF